MERNGRRESRVSLTRTIEFVVVLKDSIDGVGSRGEGRDERRGK